MPRNPKRPTISFLQILIPPNHHNRLRPLQKLLLIRNNNSKILLILENLAQKISHNPPPSQQTAITHRHQLLQTPAPDIHTSIKIRHRQSSSFQSSCSFFVCMELRVSDNVLLDDWDIQPDFRVRLSPVGVKLFRGEGV